MESSVDLEEYFVEMPLIARTRRSVAQTVRVNLAELEAPFSDGLIAEGHTAHR